MSIEIKQVKNMNFEQQWQIASAVSAETKSQFGTEQKIVPVTPILILQREIGVVALHKNQLVGYVGATNLNDRHTQIGTLVVPEHSQGSGIGQLLVAGITELVRETESQPFAFCNPGSKSSFERAGYTPALPGELPPQAQSQFNNQPMIHPRQISRSNTTQTKGLMLA